MQLELEKQEFLYSLKPKDKEVVKKAIALYYDYLDYNEAMSVKKSIDNVRVGFIAIMSLK